MHIHVDKSEQMELSQKSLPKIQTLFLFQVPMNDWKAELKSAYSFMLKYSKITACCVNYMSKYGNCII